MKAYVEKVSWVCASARLDAGFRWMVWGGVFGYVYFAVSFDCLDCVMPFVHVYIMLCGDVPLSGCCPAILMSCFVYMYILHSVMMSFSPLSALAFFLGTPTT